VPFELNARSEMALMLTKRGHPEAALEQVKRCREIVSSGEDFRGLLGRAALADAVTAANLGQHESAEERFSAAVKNLVRYDLPWERAQAERLWGEARLMAGDSAGAAERFDAAIEIYRRHEAGATWVNTVEEEKRSASRKTIAASSGARLSRPEGGAYFVEGIFRHEGDYWTLSYQGSVLRLRNTNGLHYLSHLLGHPAKRISAADLARVIRRMPPHNHSRSPGSSSERSRVMVTKGIKAANRKKFAPTVLRLAGISPPVSRPATGAFTNPIPTIRSPGKYPSPQSKPPLIPRPLLTGSSPVISRERLGEGSADSATSRHTLLVGSAICTHRVHIVP